VRGAVADKRDTNAVHRRPRPWIELPILVVAYVIYGHIRVHITPGAGPAFRNAVHVVNFERATRTYWEHTLQRPFLHIPAALTAMELYYGVVHFAVPIIVLRALYGFRPQSYRHWRNIMGWLLVVALIGFAVYPLMPPRLLPARFGFVDTATLVHGLGPIHPGKGGAGGDNPYAAMPSLHVAWSTWSACAITSPAPSVRTLCSQRRRNRASVSA
jgi:hypothetical protein